MLAFEVAKYPLAAKYKVSKYRPCCTFFSQERKIKMVHILDTKRRGYEKTPRDGYFKGHTSRIRTGYSATTPEPDNHSFLDTGLNLSLLPFFTKRTIQT